MLFLKQESVKKNNKVNLKGKLRNKFKLAEIIGIVLTQSLKYLKTQSLDPPNRSLKRALHSIQITL